MMRSVLGRLDLADLASRYALTVFLLLCIILGGASRENVIQSGMLQLVAFTVLLWCVLDPDLQVSQRGARPIVWLCAGYVMVVLLQLIPLPPVVWRGLPGREVVVDGFSALSIPDPWLPMSMTPERTLAALLQIAPPAALFVLATRLRWGDGLAHLSWIIPLAAIASLAVGLLQVGGGQDSPAYFYKTVNRGAPTGFFANANHQATFFLMSLPFVAALIGSIRHRYKIGEGQSEKAIIAIAVGAAIIVGVLVTGSIAAYLLLAPVLLASAMLVLSAGSRGRGAGLALFGLVALAALMASSPFVLQAETSLSDDGPGSRQGIYSVAVNAIRDLAPFGSGLGSFEDVYPVYENPQTVTPKFINHAHNEVLEVLFELGVPGALMLLAGVVWFLGRAASIWSETATEETRIRRAATIAIAAGLLHSLVDYPLRTATLSAVAAVCIAAMVSERRARRTLGNDADTEMRRLSL